MIQTAVLRAASLGSALRRGASLRTALRRAAFGLSALLVLAPVTPRAEPVLVELFTSQGCSACPPADAVLARLAERADVVALSLHVDYWDYLGWRDSFASPEMTARQYAYRGALGTRVVYTPQMVIEGRADVVGSRDEAVGAAVEAALAEPDAARIRIYSDGGMLKADLLPGAADGPSGGTVWVARYERKATVEVARGENRGRALDYANVVESLERIGDWPGRDAEAVMLPQPGPGEGIAVWVQSAGTGPVIAAAKHEP